MPVTQKKIAGITKEAQKAEQLKRTAAKKQAEKLLQQFNIIDAIISAKRIDVDTMSEVDKHFIDQQRLTKIKYELTVLKNTKEKLQLVYDNIKPVQRKIWIKRYINEEQDKSIILDLSNEYGIHRKRYFALKKEMINHIISAFSLLS